MSCRFGIALRHSWSGGGTYFYRCCNETKLMLAHARSRFRFPSPHRPKAMKEDEGEGGEGGSRPPFFPRRRRRGWFHGRRRASH